MLISLPGELDHEAVLVKKHLPFARLMLIQVPEDRAGLSHHPPFLLATLKARLHPLACLQPTVVPEEWQEPAEWQEFEMASRQPALSGWLQGQLMPGERLELAEEKQTAVGLAEGLPHLYQQELALWHCSCLPDVQKAVQVEDLAHMCFLHLDPAGMLLALHWPDVCQEEVES